MTDHVAFFFAHPVGAGTPWEVHENLRRARLWLAALIRAEIAFVIPTCRAVPVIFEASWLGWTHPECLAEATDRELGISFNKKWISRCDGIVTCGPRISGGMQEELETSTRHYQWFVDFTDLCQIEPPSAEIILERFAHPRQLDTLHPPIVGATVG